jgi:hypothetical protein
MYDKDEINSIAVLYSVDPKVQHFELLLKVLTPMIEKILVKHPDVKEHWEDIKQVVLIKIWDTFTSVTKCRKLWEHSIPATYFYFRIREYVSREKEKVKKMYDMYDSNMKSFEELKPWGRLQLGVDSTKDEWDDFR